jgi:hypothetical protein
VKVVTAAMAEALSERGFVQRKRRWVLLRPDLPVEVYDEKARFGPEYGIGVLFGGPGIRSNVDENACLQVSQRESAGKRLGFYYDFSDPEEPPRCERDFFAVTVPLLDRFATPQELARGLLEGEVTPSINADAASRPLAAWNVIRAYSLDHLQPQLWEEFRRAAEDRIAYERLVGLVESWPEDYPGLTEFMATVPVPPASLGHRLRTQRERILAAYRRKRYGHLLG